MRRTTLEQGRVADQPSHLTEWWLGRNGAEERQAQDKKVPAPMDTPLGTYFLLLGTQGVPPPPNSAIKC